MLVIPAIDLKEGQCVRLRQGDMADSTVFSDDPVAMAMKWHAQGARRLHLVDLDGAFAGKPVNAPIIERIAKAYDATTAIVAFLRAQRVRSTWSQIEPAVRGAATLDDLGDVFFVGIVTFVSALDTAFGFVLIACVGILVLVVILVLRPVGAENDREDPGEAGFTGSLVVAEFASLDEAKAWADKDPYIAAGVYADVLVKPFKKVLP